MNGDWRMKLVPSVEYRRAVLCARIRIGVGVWLLILTAILYGYDRGGWVESAAGTDSSTALLRRVSLATRIRATTNSRHAK
jgi:hypothetical protein